jgi:hypothetical protein
MSGVFQPRKAWQQSTTNGRTDCEATDARALSIVRSSRLVRAADRMLSAAIVAWRGSVVGTALRRLIDRGKEQTAAARARRAGGVIAVASGTALIVQRLASRPEALTWMVPALLLIGSLCLIAAARTRPSR